MKIFLRLLLVIICCSGSNAGFAQDFHYSQFYEMPMLRNPALTGMFLGDIKVATAFRTQWNGITTPYKTVSVGAEFKLPSDENRAVRLSTGLQVDRDVAGDSKLSKTQLMPVVNLHLPIQHDANSYVSVAFAGSAVHHSFDRSGLTFDDQFVNGTVTGSSGQKFNFSNRSYFNGVSLGLSYNYGGLDATDSRYYIGAAIFNIAQKEAVPYFQDTISMKYNKKISANAGSVIPTSAEDRFTFYADYFKQTGNSLFQIGALFTHDFYQHDLDQDLKTGITVGIIHRWADAVVPVIKLEYYNLVMGFSYDANISQLAVASRIKNAFELTLSYKGFLNMRNSTLRQVWCPR
ncbi:PorP/SprF family type IX secretion system membrane protein [Parasegetibacter sp. NRK P23]|uniref:PorP/SprF family type IX secretion system membrane protein n=1 Tax=Parasegetibacter sp. NRK P23 TaxID=2942999 RepID=UPI0020444823|nr:PorP/SprF family type IX secretion system membrane protein [Parasegetibacter sp. NRK P23]MCM5527891.1 PorP/SprF family type IX secretion system membrane protein [Parasegetibacter sp. NRK P23]